MSYSEFDSFDNSIEKMLSTEKRRYSSPFSYFDEIDANSIGVDKITGVKPGDYKAFVPTDDRVNSPSHYTRGKVEAIDIIEDAIQDASTPANGMLQAQVLKYLLRLWLKDNPVEDAKKAQWYLNRLVEKLEAEE